MLGTNIRGVKILPVYDALLFLLGSDGFLFTYADDVYMGGVPIQVAITLSATPGLYAAWLAYN